MATIEEALVYLLKADDSVVSLVGDRIWREVAPQDGSLPCLVYQTVAEDEVQSHDGLSGLTVEVIQIAADAVTHREAKQLSIAVREAIAGYVGTPVSGGVAIGHILHRGARSEPESVVHSDELPVRRHITDYEIAYSHAS